MIYSAILELFEKRSAIDILTITQILENRNQLELIGGSSYLAGLANEVPTSTHVFQYSIIVKQKSTLRKLLKAGQQITALGFQEADEIDQLLEKSRAKASSLYPKLSSKINSFTSARCPYQHLRKNRRST